MQNLITVSGNKFSFQARTYRCAFGRGGFSADKKEGDGVTPLGIFPLRECWYRADKMDAPKTGLPLRVIAEDDGWCDDPGSPEYNRHIKIFSRCRNEEPLPPLAGGGRRGVSFCDGDFEEDGHPRPDPLPHQATPKRSCFDFAQARAGEGDSCPSLAERPSGGMAQGVGHAAFTTRRPESIQNAKALRKNQTDAERKLWKTLRQKQLEHYKFRRQQPVGNYTVDFICMEKKLVIELDGGQHGEDKQRRYDKKRTEYLESAGYRVLRFWNNDVLQNIGGVGETILRELDSALFESAPVWRDTPLLTSPRRRGEGFERLWREDDTYDIIVPIGYNDAPVVLGKGSAIFLHVAKAGYTPTEGCIALAKPDFLAILPAIDNKTTITIKE